jgi:hypothetical protein
MNSFFTRSAAYLRALLPQRHAQIPQVPEDWKTLASIRKTARSSGAAPITSQTEKAATGPSADKAYKRRGYAAPLPAVNHSGHQSLLYRFS